MKTKTILKSVIILITLVLVILSSKPKSKNWTNSCIDGNVLAEKPRLEDDFFQSVNYDFLKNTPIPESKSRIGYSSKATDIIQNQMLALVKDSSDDVLNSNSDIFNSEEAALKYIYEQCIDWEKRNADGITPVLPLLKKFQNINSLSDFESLLYDDELRLFYPFEIRHFVRGEYNKLIFYMTFIFNETGVPRREEVISDFLRKMFIRCGYDEIEANSLITRAQRFEKELIDLGTTTTKTFYTRINDPNLEKLPIIKFMEASGYKDASECNILNYEMMKEFALSLYNEENLENLKTLCICKLLFYSASYLDKECYELKAKIDEELKGIKNDYTDEEYAMAFLNENLSMLFGKVWIKKYFSDDIKADVTEFVQTIIDEYLRQIPDWAWLSTGGRYNLGQLLKQTKIIVGYSGSFPDYTGLYSKIRKLADTESLLHSYIKICNYEQSLQVKKHFSEVDHYAWQCPPQTYNAFYMGDNNSINICAGWLCGHEYDVNMSREEKFVRIGIVMAHEMSHSFCVGDDNNGVLIGYWNENDKKALDSKLMKFADYLSSFTLYEEEKCNGPHVRFEAGADMFGFKVILNMAKQYPDFDYKKFFSCYANIWSEKTTEAYCKNSLLPDTHPIYFLRVNSEVQQFYEFYEAFNIKRGDKMYLPPTKRIRF